MIWDKDRDVLLDAVLVAISQEELARVVYKPCNAARESFVLEKLTASSGKEVDRVLGNFMIWYCPRAGCHEYLHPDDPARGADHILCGIYGDSHAILMIAKTGESGGMKALLDSINEHVKKSMGEEYAVKHVLNDIDFPDRERLMQQYIDKYSQCLPWRFRGQRADILANTDGFKEIMLHHSAVVEPALRGEVER